jgi:hypothetical protein
MQSDRQVYRNGVDDDHAHLINKLKVVREFRLGAVRAQFL